jgi:FkbM family methyltransferase
MKRPEFAVIFAKIFRSLIMMSTNFLGYRAGFRMLSYLIESLDPVITTQTKHGDIRFYCPATWPFKRSDIKGPNVMEWIDGFPEGDVFWDIGANIGVYTLYAAGRGLRVFAFEPAAVNYFVLVKNIEINEMEDRASSLNLALHEKTELSELNMSRTEIGSAQHTFGAEQTEEVDIKPHASRNKFRQTVLGYSIDEFIDVFRPEFPNRLKIDVDGNECLILKGAERTLADGRLKSFLVEVRDNTREEVKKRVTQAGFVCVEGGEQTSGVGDLLFERA